MDKEYTEVGIVKAIRKTIVQLEAELRFSEMTKASRKLWESVDEELCKFIDAPAGFIPFGSAMPGDEVDRLDALVIKWLENKELHTEEVQSWLELLADQVNDLKEAHRREQQEEEDEQCAECAASGLKPKEYDCSCHKEVDGGNVVINIHIHLK